MCDFCFNLFPLMGFFNCPIIFTVLGFFSHQLVFGLRYQQFPFKGLNICFNDFYSVMHCDG